MQLLAAAKFAFPELRLAQIIVNATSRSDPFYITDDKLADALAAFILQQGGNVPPPSETVDARAVESFRPRITIERVKEIRKTHGAGPTRTIPGEGNFAFCCCCGARTKQVREFFGYNLCEKCDEASKPHELKASEPLYTQEALDSAHERTRHRLAKLKAE